MNSIKMCCVYRLFYSGSKSQDGDTATCSGCGTVWIYDTDTECWLEEGKKNAR